jgi:hypothetical protein
MGQKIWQNDGGRIMTGCVVLPFLAPRFETGCVVLPFLAPRFETGCVVLPFSSTKVRTRPAFAQEIKLSNTANQDEFSNFKLIHTPKVDARA